MEDLSDSWKDSAERISVVETELLDGQCRGFDSRRSDGNEILTGP